MKEKNLLAIGLVFLIILLGACRSTQSTGSTAPATTASQSTAPAPAPAPAIQPCAANFTASGNLLRGQTVKSFQEFPNASKNPTFTYLVSKLSSLGYKINSSDRESGLISASKHPASIKGTGETNTLNAVVTPLNPAGVRVEFTYHAAVYGNISSPHAKQEFCEVLNGVPTEKTPAAVAKPAEEVKPAVQPAPLKTTTAEPSPLPPPPALKKVTVIVATENIREVPKGKIIGKVTKGATLVVLEEQPQWLKIRVESGTEAWIWKASTSGGN
jgi:hypothetical protein